MRKFPWLAGIVALVVVVFSNAALAQGDDGSIGAAYTLYNKAAERGDAEDMEKYARRAYDRAEKEWDKDNIQLGYLAANYAEALDLNGNYREAIGLYEDCIRVLEKYLPDTVSDVAMCWQGYSLAKLQRGAIEGAIKGFESLIELGGGEQDDPLLRKMVADSHYLIANILLPKEALYMHGYVFPKKGRFDFVTMAYPAENYARALVHAEAGLPLLVSAYGEQSLEVARTRVLLGFQALWQEDVDRVTAHEQFGKALETMKALKGEDDQETLWVAVRARRSSSEEEGPDDWRKRWANPEDCETGERDGVPYHNCALDREEPRYPDKLMFEGIAVVEVQFDISPDGNTQNIRVLYENVPGFSELCVEAVEKWKYARPIDESGNPTVLEGYVTSFRFQVAQGSFNSF